GIEAFNDQEYFELTNSKIITGRQLLIQELETLDFEVLPSSANFVFATHPQYDAEALSAGLRQQGIIVRHFKHKRISQFLRITIGTSEQNQRLVQELKALM
ncbi:MAG: aminotransferase class I/II-fold pyridoxal phosphate-dependent enzyme, partial [Methylophagaceae bacterium]